MFVCGDEVAYPLKVVSPDQALQGGAAGRGRCLGAPCVRAIATLIPAVCAALLLGDPTWAGGSEIKVYKTPTCGCCTKWIDHLEASGFSVEAQELPDLTTLKRSNGIPQSLSSCHTAFVRGYVIEGHVPARDSERLLKQRPDVVGLTVPGMPVGSPGMEGPNPQRYEVLTFDSGGETTVFATHGP